MHMGAIYFEYWTASASRLACPCVRMTACIARAILAVTLVVVLMAGSSASFAQGAQTTYLRLGTPKVLSPLGSPLWVKIPVDGADTNADLAASNFSLGARPVNAGIPFLENAEISFERRDSKYYLVIRSRQPIDELAIGVIVRERLTNGVRSREFALLLDPPPLFEARVGEREIDLAVSAATTLSQAPARQQPAMIARQQAVLPPDVPAVPARVVRQPRAAGKVETLGRNTAPQTQSEPYTPPTSASVKPPSRRANSPTTRAKSQSVTPKARPEAAMRLSLSTQSLSALPNASEATRAELRRRQFILDTDDLTSALLERNHRIGLLENELANLAARVSATERSLNINRAVPAPVSRAASDPTIPKLSRASAADIVPRVVEPRGVQADPVPAVVAPVQETKKMATAVAAPTTVAPPSRSTPVWTMLLVVVAVLTLGFAVFSLTRRRMEARDESFRVVHQQADAYVSEVLAKSPKGSVSRPLPAAVTEKTVELEAPLIATAEPDFPEIHFELPDEAALPQIMSELDAHSATLEIPAEVIHFPVPVVSAEITPPKDLRGRRMRYLQSRFQDIAILLPPLDAPQRLLNQAGRIHDEGAVEYTKRLLKFAAYSRPHTEEFWLALLEVLYREKFANDYLVNAKWFREYHPQSANWDEVQRIGYLLNPAAPIFASAAAWSHEEPAVGVWLPANQIQAKVVASRPKLKLELAN